MTMRSWILALAALSLAVAPAEASDKKPEAKKVEKGTDKEDTLAWRRPGPKHLQLASLMAPVESADGLRKSMVTVTLVIKTLTSDDVPKICSLTPRVNDAALTELHRRPIRLRPDREMDVDEAGPRLKAPINRALGKAMADEVFIVPGAKKMGSGSMSRLPFASVFGCRELKLDESASDKKKDGEKKDGEKDDKKKH
ncbi:MAG: hypothetical protein H7841_08825 [Magnetospirillum sp. WYHS-4]